MSLFNQAMVLVVLVVAHCWIIWWVIEESSKIHSKENDDE